MATYKVNIGGKELKIVGSRDKVRTIMYRFGKPLQVQQYKRDGDFVSFSPFSPQWGLQSDTDKAQYKQECDTFIESIPTVMSTRKPAEYANALKRADELFNRWLPK